MPNAQHALQGFLSPASEGHTCRWAGFLSLRGLESPVPRTSLSNEQLSPGTDRRECAHGRVGTALHLGRVRLCSQLPPGSSRQPAESPGPGHLDLEQGCGQQPWGPLDVSQGPIGLAAPFPASWRLVAAPLLQPAWREDPAAALPRQVRLQCSVGGIHLLQAVLGQETASLWGRW